MGNFFKFRKHGLAEQRTFEHIKVMIQKPELFVRITASFKQIMHEQCFIAGGGNFSHKNAVAGIHIVVSVIGIP